MTDKLLFRFIHLLYFNFSVNIYLFRAIDARGVNFLFIYAIRLRMWQASHSNVVPRNRHIYFAWKPPGSISLAIENVPFNSFCVLPKIYKKWLKEAKILLGAFYLPRIE